MKQKLSQDKMRIRIIFQALTIRIFYVMLNKWNPKNLALSMKIFNPKINKR